jgi:hypothetical protein
VLRAFRTTEQTSDEALYMILDAYAIRLANIKTVYYCNNSNGISVALDMIDSAMLMTRFMKVSK